MVKWNESNDDEARIEELEARVRELERELDDLYRQMRHFRARSTRPVKRANDATS